MGVMRPLTILLMGLLALPLLFGSRKGVCWLRDVWVKFIISCLKTIVGLDFVHEIIACSNAEVEPYYQCMLCGNQGEPNGMYNHIFGKKHREKFLEKKYPNDPR